MVLSFFLKFHTKNHVVYWKQVVKRTSINSQTCMRLGEHIIKYFLSSCLEIADSVCLMISLVCPVCAPCFYILVIQTFSHVLVTQCYI